MASSRACPTRRLKDCASWFSGGTPSKATSTYWGGTIPWISAKSLNDFFISDSKDRVTEEGAQNGTRLVPANTILFIVRGMSLKSEFRMGITTRPVTFNQDLKALVAVDDIDPGYLAYAIKAKTTEILELVEEAGHGTGVLPTDRIQAVEIPVPSITQQRAIAQILRSIDDKIELNRRMSNTLEEIADRTFHASFSNLHDLASGCRKGKFSELVEYIRDIENPVTAPDTLFKHFSIPAFDNGQSPVSELGEKIRSQKFCVPPDVVLLSKLNPEIARVWLVDVKPGERAICSTEFLVLMARQPFGKFYLYSLSRSLTFRQQLQGLVTGTSKSHQRAQPDSILSLPVVIPPDDVVREFNERFAPLLKRASASRIQIQILAEIRDALLPQLIFGVVKPKEAEDLVENII